MIAQTSNRTPKRKISGSFQRFWGGRWLYTAFGSWQRNSELNLDSRLLAGRSAGLHLLRTLENDLIVSAGVDVSSEAFSDERAATQSVEALASLNYRLYALGGREFKVAAGFTLFPSLSVRGRLRFEGNLDLRKELFRNFYLNLRVFDSFDNHTEGAGATKNDLGITTSFGWSF